MSDSDIDPHVPISEVGCEGQSNKDTQPHNQPSNSGLLTNMEALLTRLLTTPQQIPQTASNTNAVQLVKLDPDDADADVEGWCRITELIVNSKKLSGVELLVALTTALKGRAASCLTKLRLEDLTWEIVKQTLLAKFAQPKLMQDYFDDILRFQTEAKETASESAMRLWSLIERIPKVEMTEEVITGFVVSVLSSKDHMIRRELNSCAITTRAQLFRTLGGISLKRRAEDNDDNKAKRPRLSDSKFNGKCHRCGVPGHRIADCKRRRDDPANQTNSSSDKDKDKLPPVTCFKCGKSGHVSTACPEKRSGAVVREVNTCEHKTSRGTLVTSSGPKVKTAIDIENHIIEVRSIIADYGEKITTFDTEISALMTSYQDQITQMQYELEIGLENMAEALANRKTDTNDAMELNSRFSILQVDLDKTVIMQNELDSIQDNLSVDLKEMLHEMEALDGLKSNRDEVQEALDTKAGISALNGMVALCQYEAVRGDFQKQICKAFDKFNNQEVVWQKCIDELARSVSEKADKYLVLGLEQDLKNNIIKLKDRLDFMLNICEDTNVAYQKKGIVRQGPCLSCSMPYGEEETEEDTEEDTEDSLGERPEPIGAKTDEEDKKEDEDIHPVCYKRVPIPHSLDSRAQICSRYCGGPITAKTQKIISDDVTTSIIVKHLKREIPNIQQVKINKRPCRPCNPRQRKISISPKLGILSDASDAEMLVQNIVLDNSKLCPATSCTPEPEEADLN